MKLSAKTIQVLKNFSMINESMMFNTGNVLSTVSPNKEILAKATVDETFDKEFAIYNIVKLLGTISLFNEPDIQFEDRCLKVNNGKESMSYYYTDPNLIVKPSSKEIVMNDPEINFDMPQQTYQSIMKALHVLQLPSIAVTGDRNVIKLVAMDAETKTNNNTYEVEVGTTSHDFKMIIKGEHLKLLQDNYSVSISSKGISTVKGDNIQYWIAISGKTSTFTK